MRMRAPPEDVEQQLAQMDREDDSDDEPSPLEEKWPPGTFPGSRSMTTDSSYY
jgi:hypothetical protein